MEVLYDTFHIQPLINSKILMDIETTQKITYSPQTLRTATTQNLVRIKMFQKKEKSLNNYNHILKRKDIGAKFLRKNLAQGKVL